MRTFQICNKLTKHSLKHKAVAIGNFDLIHLGHQKVFVNANTILTFENIPKKQNNISSFKDKKHFFNEHHYKIYVYDLAKSNHNLTAIDFYHQYLEQAKQIYVGADFKFGSDQILINDFIRTYHIKNITVIDLIPNCSSSIIKRLLSEGKIKEANALLLEPYHLEAKVKHGNHIGRQIGYRTINFYFDSHSQPLIPYGVYISRTHIDGHSYPSVTFWGIPKSINKQTVSHVETHIIGVDKNLYYKYLRVDIIDRIADIKKFPSLDALKQAISEYVSLAKSSA